MDIEGFECVGRGGWGDKSGGGQVIGMRLVDIACVGAEVLSPNFFYDEGSIPMMFPSMNKQTNSLPLFIDGNLQVPSPSLLPFLNCPI